MKKPKLKRDWEGLLVQTKVELTTKDGSIFPAGARMRVSRNYGGLHLDYVEACDSCKLKHRHHIKGVRESSVVILEE